MTLAAVSLAYYRHVMDAGTAQVRALRTECMVVRAEGKTPRQVAEEGLAALEAWMRQIGVVMNLTELGVKPEMFEGIANGTFILKGGYKELTHDEVVEILKESM